MKLTPKDNEPSERVMRDNPAYLRAVAEARANGVAVIPADNAASTRRSFLDWASKNGVTDLRCSVRNSRTYVHTPDADLPASVYTKTKIWSSVFQEAEKKGWYIYQGPDARAYAGALKHYIKSAGPPWALAQRGNTVYLWRRGETEGPPSRTRGPAPNANPHYVKAIIKAEMGKRVSLGPKEHGGKCRSCYLSLKDRLLREGLLDRVAIRRQGDYVFVYPKPK